jgi:2-methylisocitrate lyase-like PEP mutase family enzyme
MNSYQTFLKLHQSQTPLLLGNVWDVQSAQIFVKQGFKAIATSSAAVAHAWGYEDGEELPFELLLQTVKGITSRVKTVPVSVDIEGGYSRDVDGIIKNILKLHEMGVVGINIEDSVMGERRTLLPAKEFEQTLRAITGYLKKQDVNIFVNARTDAFLMGIANPLPETLSRIQIYELAGATGIFVPCITQPDDISQVVRGTRLPVNVLSMPALPDFTALTSLGVKRISMGNAVHDFLTASLQQKIEDVVKDQSFKSLF